MKNVAAVATSMSISISISISTTTAMSTVMSMNTKSIVTATESIMLTRRAAVAVDAVTTTNVK